MSVTDLFCFGRNKVISQDNYKYSKTVQSERVEGLTTASASSIEPAKVAGLQTFADTKPARVMGIDDRDAH